MAISEKIHQKLTLQTVGIYSKKPNRQIFVTKAGGEFENLDAVVFLTNRFYVAVHQFSGRYITGYRSRQKVIRIACSAGVFFERAICSRKRHVETSRREEEMRRVKGSGEGAGREKRKRRIFFSPPPFPLSFFRPRTYRKGYYFYFPKFSTVIKSKMAATTILRTRTRFRPPKIRLHCRLW